MSEIRIRNDTGHPLDEVRVVAPASRPEGPIVLGPVQPGAVSDWHPVTTVLRYPAIEAAGPDTDLVHLPYESATQPAMPDGRYTYVLRVESDRLVVDLMTEAEGTEDTAEP